MGEGDFVSRWAGKTGALCACGLENSNDRSSLRGFPFLPDASLGGSFASLAAERASEPRRLGMSGVIVMVVADETAVGGGCCEPRLTADFPGG